MPNSPCIHCGTGLWGVKGVNKKGANGAFFLEGQTLVVVAFRAVYVAVLFLFVGGFTHFGDFHGEVQGFACQRRGPASVWAWNCMPGCRFSSLPSKAVFGTCWISCS